MPAKQFRIRFKIPAQVEKAPPDPRQGGFVVEHIAAGTEMLVSQASYQFWNARGCIELMEKPQGRRHPVSEEILPEIAHDDITERLPSKTSIRQAAAAARKALSGEKEDMSTLADKLGYICREVTLDVAAILDDDWTVLTTAFEDLKSFAGAERIRVSKREIIESLRNVEDLLAPPSLKRRSRAKT